MTYYEQIKDKLINNEITKKVKDYSKNRSDLETYYEVGKLLYEAGKKYGERIIQEYSKKLTQEFGKGYSTRSLYNMRSYYMLILNNKILQPLVANLTWSHYTILLQLKDINKIYYYIKQSISYNLSKRELISRIKNKEYERLPEKTKDELITMEDKKLKDLVKNPILIRNRYGYNIISEKILKKLILEDIDNFLKELGEGFCYIENEYKIKIGDRYNYIDLLLFNIKYNCYVVVELKVTELKKEHIGQIETYMNYIDKNIKTIYQDKTIGIIIVKKNNQYILEYVSDDRILNTTYILDNK